MSNSESSTNNKLPPPPSPLRLVSGNKRTRHAGFYYEDGSTVFQAGRCLFKIQASLLKADPGVEWYKFETIMKRRLENFSVSNDEPGSSDSNPIVLPLNAYRFEVFFFAVFGSLGNPAIAGPLAAPSEREREGPSFLIHYLTISTVASYFGMKTLESWAVSKLRFILELAESIAAQEWPRPHTKRLSDYLQTTDIPELQNELLVFLQLVFSLSTAAPSEQLTDNLTLRLMICTELYKTQTLATSNPALFGFVFATVLSFGHRSPFWTENLTRDDRAVLYAASVNLTRLSNHTDLQVGWLDEPINVMVTCSTTDSCSEHGPRIWNKTFGESECLDSAVPLEDITQILRLPKYRFAFAKECSDWNCQFRCAQKSLDNIDAAMRELFCGLTKKHEALVRNM